MNKKTKKNIKKKEPKKNGRPSLYSQDLADEICLRIASGQSLRKIAANDNMPNIVTIWRWLDKEEFSKQYARAKEEQAELLADEITEIADSIMPVGIDGKIDGGAVNQARLRVDARKWVASKLKPKKYGDSTTIKGDVDNPLQVKQDITLTPHDAYLKMLNGK